MKTAILTAALIATTTMGAFADDCKVLEMYGKFESDKLEGWEIIDKVSTHVVEPRTDKKGGNWFHASHYDDSYTGYMSSGIKIDPAVTWMPTKSCNISFEIGGDGGNSMFGYILGVMIRAKDNKNKVYKFAYIVAQGGSYEYAELMDVEKIGWNVKGPLSQKYSYAGEHMIMPDERTFTKWLGKYPKSPQSSIWRLQPNNRMVTIKENLMKAFKVKGAPSKPMKLTITSVEFFNSMHKETDWKLDNVKLSGTGIKNIRLR